MRNVNKSVYMEKALLKLLKIEAIIGDRQHNL
jgi:hypothetical protein